MLRGLKGLGFPLPFSKRSKNLVASNWRGVIDTGVSEAKVGDPRSDILYFTNAGTTYLYVPKYGKQLNALKEGRSPFLVSSARFDQIAKDHDKDLEGLGLCAPSISLEGNVVPLPCEEEWSATTSLRNLVEREWKGLNCATYAVHGILNSAVGATTRALNILNALEDGKVAYEIHKFDISACYYTDFGGTEHKVDVDELHKCNEDPLGSYSEKIIDGINTVKGRRDALNCTLRQLMRGGISPNDVYLLSIDRKGIDVLAEYCIKLPTKDQYRFEEHRIEFEGEMNDIEAFCRLLIELEDELITRNYQGGVSKTKSGVYVADQYTKLHNLFSSQVFPTCLDWTEKVNPIPRVLDQGKFGTCWAMSATSATEYRNLINSGWYVPFSAQQIIDHMPEDTCHPLAAFQYILDNGLASAVDYPYMGYKCPSKPLKPVFNITGISGWGSFLHRKWLSLDPITTSHPVDVIKELQSGPVVVNMNGPCLRRYKEGDDLLECDPLEYPNHAVLCVGYDFTTKLRWKLQNSWGANWGKGGYFHYGDSNRGGRPRCFGDLFLYAFGDFCLRPT